MLIRFFLVHVISRLYQTLMTECYFNVTDLQLGVPDACPDELLMDSSEWPEKKYLLYQESQRKSISRLRSTDSLVLSSPLQQQEGQ